MKRRQFILGTGAALVTVPLSAKLLSDPVLRKDFEHHAVTKGDDSSKYYVDGVQTHDFGKDDFTVEFWVNTKTGEVTM